MLACCPGVGGSTTWDADLLVEEGLADGARHSAGGRGGSGGLGHGGATVSDVRDPRCLEFD
jgi:hypothetical protein